MGQKAELEFEIWGFTSRVLLAFFIPLFFSWQGPAEGPDPSGNAARCPPAQLAPEGEATTDCSAASSPTVCTLTSCQHQ